MTLIDVGCFNGDSVLHFAAYPEIDKIEAYDPNTDYQLIWSAIEAVYPYVTFYNEAVSNYNGKAMFTKRPFDRPLGSTICKDKRDFGDGKVTEIDCIDVADIVNEDCWMKLDGEGSELNILECLIEADKLKYIKRLYIEWHGSKMKDKTDYENRRYKILRHLEGMDVRNW